MNKNDITVIIWAHRFTSTDGAEYFNYEWKGPEDGIFGVPQESVGYEWPPADFPWDVERLGIDDYGMIYFRRKTKAVDVSR